jgi:hypothetical protein
MVLKVYIKLYLAKVFHRGKSVKHLALSVNPALLIDELALFVYGRNN